MKAVKLLLMLLVSLELTIEGARAADSGKADEGRVLADRLCARCHAIGPSGRSPFEPAPAFRDLVKKWPDTEVLAEALAEGISVGHPAMPEFVLEPDEIGELLSYLETLKQ